MPHRRSRKSPSLVAQAAEMALAVPQVVAHRVTRMAMAGPLPSMRDRKEFDLMVAEKESAFVESWNAMARHAAQSQQALALTMLRSVWSPSLKSLPTPAAIAAQLHDAALGLVAQGMTPLHRKAVANAKRLARTRLR